MKTISTAQLLNPYTFLAHLWGLRRLVYQFALRDFQLRFKGTFFGFAWSLVVPLVMLLVYTFVFSVVFKARWGDLPSESKAMFAVILFGNLVPYNLFADVVGSSSGLMFQHQNLIKKVVFPLEILPASRLASALLQSLLSLIIFLLGTIFVHSFHWTIVLSPLVLGPIVLFSLGLSYLVSALTVFVRDIGQIIGVLLTLVLFMSPVFYPIEAVPESLRWIVYLNPLAQVVEQFRVISVTGGLPDLLVITLLWVSSLICAALGFMFFMKTKLSFADVL